MGCLMARQAGSSPPMPPMAQAIAAAMAMSDGVMVSEYTSCESHRDPPSVLMALPSNAR